MKTQSLKQTAIIASGLAFFMLLTRGSHTLTPFSLPDASIILFLLGGLYLKRAGWFAAFFALGSAIDFGAAALDPAQGFCLTNGYWGLIPAYGAMWLGGMWLGKQNKPLNMAQFALVGITTAFVAFVISTQTYYLFSGRFPSATLLTAMQHGWNYLPSWMIQAASYMAVFILSQYLTTLFGQFKVTKA
jgi:hypothetical protein